MRESGNKHLRRREVSCTFLFFTVNETNWKVLWGCYNGWSFRSRMECLSRLYCGLVLLGQWFIVVQAVTSLFFEGLAQMNTFFFFLIFSIWYLQSA